MTQEVLSNEKGGKMNILLTLKNMVGILILAIIEKTLMIGWGLIRTLIYFYLLWLGINFLEVA